MADFLSSKPVVLFSTIAGILIVVVAAYIAYRRSKRGTFFQTLSAWAAVVGLVATLVPLGFQTLYLTFHPPYTVGMASQMLQSRAECFNTGGTLKLEGDPTETVADFFSCNHGQNFYAPYVSSFSVPIVLQPDLHIQSVGGRFGIDVSGASGATEHPTATVLWKIEYNGKTLCQMQSTASSPSLCVVDNPSVHKVVNNLPITVTAVAKDDAFGQYARYTDLYAGATGFTLSIS